MAAVIDLRAPDTITHQTISNGTSIIPNSVLLSSPLLLPADLNIYSQVFIHKPVFMGKRNATQAGEDKLPHMKKVSGSDSFITEHFIPAHTPSPPLPSL